jgi:hypothetical protein
MLKEWIALRRYPILHKNGLKLTILQFQFFWLAIRKPTRSDYPKVQNIEESQGVVWFNFNVWLTFQLRFINAKYWATSPLIRAVTLVNLGEVYESDQFRISNNDFVKINELAAKYSRTFAGIKKLEFKNWLVRNYILAKSFSDLGFDPVSKSRNLVEIGPGLGAVISLALESSCKSYYSFDTLEMQSVFSAITKEYPLDYQRVSLIPTNDNRVTRPFSIAEDDYSVIAFWSFTELKEVERDFYSELFKSASYVLIGTNENFEGINNFEYIEQMARQLELTCSWKSLDNVFSTQIPPYQKRHRIYLLQKKAR